MTVFDLAFTPAEEAAIASDAPPAAPWADALPRRLLACWPSMGEEARRAAVAVAARVRQSPAGMTVTVPTDLLARCGGVPALALIYACRRAGLAPPEHITRGGEGGARDAAETIARLNHFEGWSMRRDAGAFVFEFA